MIEDKLSDLRQELRMLKWWATPSRLRDIRKYRGFFRPNILSLFKVCVPWVLKAKRCVFSAKFDIGDKVILTDGRTGKVTEVIYSRKVKWRDLSRFNFYGVRLKSVDSEPEEIVVAEDEILKGADTWVRKSKNEKKEEETE
jgi:hypothetical protein